MTQRNVSKRRDLVCKNALMVTLNHITHCPSLPLGPQTGSLGEPK